MHSQVPVVAVWFYRLLLCSRNAANRLEWRFGDGKVNFGGHAWKSRGVLFTLTGFPSRLWCFEEKVKSCVKVKYRIITNKAVEKFFLAFHNCVLSLEQSGDILHFKIHVSIEKQRPPWTLRHRRIKDGTALTRVQSSASYVFSSSFFSSLHCKTKIVLKWVKASSHTKVLRGPAGSTSFHYTNIKISFILQDTVLCFRDSSLIALPLESADRVFFSPCLRLSSSSSSSPPPKHPFLPSALSPPLSLPSAMSISSCHLSDML